MADGIEKDADNEANEKKEEEEVEDDPGEFVEGWVLRTPKTAADWVRRWAMNSSCNGIPNIQRSRHLVRRIFWVLVVLAGTAKTAMDVVATFQLYFSYPINVVVRIELQTSLEFPAVTLCNINPIRKSKIPLGGKDFQDRLSEEPSLNNIGLNNKEQHEIAEYFHNNFSMFANTTQLEMGHQIDDMILACLFDKKPCSSNDFKPFIDARYGPCYTFNSERDSTQTRRVYKAGPSHGLSLELYVEVQEYVPLLTQALGLRIAVNDPEAMPFPEDTGYYVSPGHETAIAMRKLEVTRMKGPYPSQCWHIEEDDAVKLSVYSQIYGYDYSQEACYKTCYQRAVIKDCGCGDPTVPLRGKAFSNDDSGSYPCLSHQSEVCEERIKALANEGKLGCNCSVACRSVTFPSTVSAAKWPNDFLQGVYSQKVLAAYKGDSTGHTDPRDNVAKVHIFYPVMDTEFVEEQEAYSAINFYSDLGGNLGFYLGLSIISIFEFFELIPDLIRSCYRTSKHKKKIKKNPQAMALQKNGNANKSFKNDDLGDNFKTKYDSKPNSI